MYDALNVLMAMDIIAKHKKEILWRGLPHNQTTVLERLKGDRLRLAGHINKQRAYIQVCCPGEAGTGTCRSQRDRNSACSLQICFGPSGRLSR